ncbi:hypothetical protein [Lysinibacter cavernae]|uniref:Uncharacterized protein n=1 Tax=Lysinibacter cavernae TaxID=1640652 RepID=A0A7X5TRH3_9MICO|nr:hypothetical protein [Lysinibacter cavernae]NIH52161.1 hypothetical protein [Lysinibacter cavernae]
MAQPKLTKTRQHVAIGEGLALGCLAVGIQGLSTNQLTLDQGFRYAWPRWDSSRRFPNVNVGVKYNDIRSILEKSGRRQGQPVAAFRVEQGQGFVPYLRNGIHSVNDAAARLEEETGVPLTAWKALAELTAKGLI